ncbi:MAG: hypothetical protein J7D60_09005, partial [Prosthecochloris sp.]|nr:hypothetical protein [Prosthecochloris sp.]
RQPTNSADSILQFQLRQNRPRLAMVHQELHGPPDHKPTLPVQHTLYPTYAEVPHFFLAS